MRKNCKKYMNRLDTTIKSLDQCYYKGYESIHFEND